MPEPMTLKVHIRGDRAAVVTVAGDVDATGTGALETLVRLAETRLDLVIDLSGVTSLDPSGVPVLVRAREACLDRGRALIVTAPSAAVRGVLAVAEVDHGLTTASKPVLRPDERAQSRIPSAHIVDLQAAGRGTRHPSAARPLEHQPGAVSRPYLPRAARRLPDWTGTTTEVPSA
jgi:anti-anti-sigma factor